MEILTTQFLSNQLEVEKHDVVQVSFRTTNLTSLLGDICVM